MMSVTVIIPSLASEKTKPYLKLTVESLRATTGWTIVVVTNGSKEKPDLSDIKGLSNHIHTTDQGQCIATNIGAQIALDDYLLISNDDMYYAPNWHKNIKFDYPIFSPNLVEPTNNAGSAAPFRKLDAGFTLEEFNKALIDSYVDDVTYALSTKPTQVGPGFNLPFFIQRDLWNFLGGYDVAFDPWGSNSDTDLQTRINLAGITPMRVEDVLVYHFSNKSGTFDGTHQDFYQHNIDYFKAKFGFDRDELGSDVWYNKDMIPADSRKIKYQQRQYEQHNP